MAANPNGFKAARHLNGNTTFRATSYQVDDSNPKPIYQGMAVALSSGKVVEHTSTSTSPVLGVVKAAYSGTKNRPKTHALPDGGNYIAASTAGYVDVYTDPQIVYEVVADSGMAATQVGNLADIVASPTGNTTTGISSMQLDTTTFAAQTSANVQTLPFRVVGLARGEVAPAGNGYSSDAQKVEVVINDHVLNQKFPS